MADEGKLLVDLQHCHKFHYTSYHQTVLFTANAMQVILKEQSLQHEEAAKKLRNGLEYAAKFDFVGGGSTNILPNNLTGANMELKRISNAIEDGIAKFPKLGCDNVHSYLDDMSSKTLTQIPIMLQNLGVEENPKFRKISLVKRNPGEKKESLIVRIVEAYTPKDVALPASIQKLKDELEQRKNKAIAEVADCERVQANLRLDTISEDKRPEFSNKRMRDVKHFIEYFSPDTKKRRAITDVFRPEIVNSSLWNSSSFDSKVFKKTEN